MYSREIDEVMNVFWLGWGWGQLSKGLDWGEVAGIQPFILHDPAW